MLSPGQSARTDGNLGVRQDLAIAEAQVREYQVRLGRPFLHESYLAQLTALRDQLKTCLAGLPADPSTEPLPRASDLADQINALNALKAAHTIEAAPERIGKRRGSAEEPVTAHPPPDGGDSHVRYRTVTGKRLSAAVC